MVKLHAIIKQALERDISDIDICRETVIYNAVMGQVQPLVEALEKVVWLEVELYGKESRLSEIAKQALAQLEADDATN